MALARLGDGGDGVLASVRAGVRAGSLAGLVFGLADGVAALLLVPGAAGFLGALGCLAAAVLQYCVVAGLGLGLAGLVLHVALRRRDFARRYALLLALGLGAGLFAELYWRTRDFVFYGYSARSPQRLAAAAAMLAVAAVLGFVLARSLVRLGRRVQVAFALVLSVAWLAGALFLAAQSGRGAERGAPNERNRDLPNVVLVVVDALRQDVLGCYGNERVRTPNLDRLAREGVLFENAFVQAPYTWTSFGSLLTGKYPRRHGLIKMDARRTLPAQATLPWHLKHAVRADGRALHEDDYVTASFHTGTLSAETGLLRGFDLVFEETAGHELQDLASAWSRVRARLLLWIFKQRIEKQIDSGLTAREAVRWLRTLGDRRFMTMVHLFTTHTPYDPPAEFRRLYEDPAYQGPMHSFSFEHRKAIEDGVYAPTEADVRRVRDLYAAGVSQADALVGDIVAELERSGRRENTLIVVTGDHGESLGEDGLWEHDHMVRRELRVPLLVAWPGHLPAGKRVSALTDEIDVLPTVCALARLAPPAATDELARLDGVDLLPLVRGEVPSVRRFSFAETGVELSIQDLGRKLVVPREVLVPDAFDQVRARFELVQRARAPRPKLVEYATPHDLAEPDVLPQREDEAVELLRELHAWSRALPIRAEEVLPSGRDEESRTLLKRYGYTGGDDESAPPEHTPPKQTPPGREERQ